MLQPLKLSLLGSPQLYMGEQSLNGLLSGKTLALFVYLAVTAAQGRPPHARDLLADLLWSELSNQQARNNLRYLLSDLRKVVDDYLAITPQTIGFNVQKPYWLDVEVLQMTLSARPAEVTAAELQAALDLYGGEFLAGFSVRNAPIFEEWVNRCRAEFHTLASQGFQRLAEHYFQQGRYPATLAATQQLLQLAPWHEAGYRLQMQLLLNKGQRNAALELYQRLQHLLATELGAAPEEETVALYEQIRTGESEYKATGWENGSMTRWQDDQMTPDQRPASPDHPVSTSLRHNLPSQLTPFIGRAEEIAMIRNTLLDPNQRLVTLVGEGGIGKTRLALAVAQSILDFEFAILDSPDNIVAQPGNLKSKIQTPKFADGIWLVPLVGLAPAADLPERLAGAIGTAMQLALSGQMPLSQQLFRHLNTKETLLLLDSFEHLLDGADFVLDLLRHTSHVKVLVTSRHILNFQAEYAWRVEGLLAPPADNDSLSPDLLLRYDSVALFVERARRVVRGFTLNEKNQQEIARICQFVDGLPLGAELAAALTRHYTCAEIAQALDENYTILATAQRDIPPRHRSIQATLAYSWSFLNAEESRTAAQCSIFRSGFTLHAAEQIVGVSRPLLNALEDHSLLRLVRDRAGQGRYEMHELVRQYAASQLQTMPTLVQETQSRFAAYYMDFVQQRVEALVHDQQAQNEMQTELNNVRQTWRWIIEQADILALGRISDGLFRFYFIMGMYQEGEAAAQAAVGATRNWLTRAHQESTPLVTKAPLWQQAEYEHIRALFTQGRFCERLARLEQSEQLTLAGITRALALGSVELEARGYLGMAALAQTRHDYATMRVMGEKLVAIPANSDYPPLERMRAQSYGHKFIGTCHVYMNNYPAAMVSFNQGLHLAQQIQDRELEIMLVNNLGVVYSMAGYFSQALHNYQEAFALSRTLGEHNGEGLALLNLGETYHALGDWEEAKDRIGAALTLYHETGYQLYEVKAWARLGRIAHAAGNPEMAYAYLQQALQLAHTAGLHVVKAEFLTDLGHVLISLQRFEEAVIAYQQALPHWQQTALWPAVCRVQAGVAYIALLQGQIAAAYATIQEILPILEQTPPNANYEPIFVYWVCFQVMTANQAPEAGVMLQRGYKLLQSYADQIKDKRLQRLFLENVSVNRALFALAQQAGLTSSTTV